MRFAFAFSLFALVILSGCSEPNMAVHGDSTAIASRDGFAKIYNYFPSFDSARWWNIVSQSYDPARYVFNDGVGGQDIKTMRLKMQNDVSHRSITTVIYDRRNTGETPDAYMIDLSTAIGVLETDHFLIVPQVPQSEGSPDDGDQLQAMAMINEKVISKWPQNTFSQEDRIAFLGELAADDTRIDRLHRNEKGQRIEASYIGGWLHKRGW